MRLLITSLLIWVAFSLPLALLAGRALRSRGRPPTIADEVEDYLRSRRPAAKPVLASAVGVVAAFSLALVVGAGASSDLPEEAMVTLAQWHEEVFPETTTTAAPAPPAPETAVAEAPAPAGDRRARHRERPAPIAIEDLRVAAPPTTVAPPEPPAAGATTAPEDEALQGGEGHRHPDGEGRPGDRSGDDGERRRGGTTTTSTTSTTSTSTTSTTAPPDSTTTTSTTTSTTSTTAPSGRG